MSTGNDPLEPIEPGTARELYLKHKRMDYRERTMQAHQYRTGHFVRWCGENDIENLNNLTGRHLQEYKLWRQDECDLKKISLKQQLCTLRVFLKWCESIEAVSADLYEKVAVPRVSPEEERRDEMIEADTAQTIRQHLATYYYASIEHVIFALLWETGIRTGSAISIDVDDVDVDGEYIELVHRPDDGTTLKNGIAGERPIALTSELASLLGEFIDNTRNEILDDHGRAPLLTTSVGRMHGSTLRRLLYRITAPCFRNEACPDCTGPNGKKCGESVNPHAIRRGSITHFLTKNVPAEIVGDRMNVSRDILDKHYDRRSEEVKLEQRRGYLDNI